MIESHIRADVPLAPRTTIGVGGPARHFVTAAREQDVVEAAVWAQAQGEPLLVLGGGSNLVVADGGYPGLVVEIAIGGVSIERAAGRAIVNVGAGEPWDGLVARSVAEGLAGIECLSGVPGRVGATPVQNVGAYGQEVSETIESVRALDRTTGRIVEIGAGQCGFDYRTSAFKRPGGERWIVLGVRFVLSPGGAPAVRYPELARALAGGAGAPSLADVRRTVLALRRDKSMVIDPGDPESRSAGSFFLNVVVDAEGLAALVAAGRQSGVLREGEAPPTFPASGGRTKVPTAWLIERAGCHRGDALGGARISRKHALALVNGGDATAADVVALARRVQERVRAAFGVVLAHEPVMAGFEDGAGTAQ